ncbi:unnamed protein product [Allacma fusca]|uniref:RCR-type E3 ubiquitin transferase n=1 Tax=Allacma fusca TaxID=39272 RepID=A0A8J2L8K4_9HEXA|nr:unnamed protein product [Allacma fusca]
MGLLYFVSFHFLNTKVVDEQREKSKEREFVADFIARTSNSSGERLANWLQPESFVDPQKCEVVTSKESIKRGKPTVLVIVTRDQYGEPVVAENLVVELKAVPQMTSEPCPRSSCILSGLYNCLPGHDADNLEVAFQVTIKDKMKYHAITMMKEYENYSFEELRLMSPMVRRISESMLVRQNNNATYTATWTPACKGLYYISLTVDGYTISQITKVDVEDVPEGSFLLQPKKAEENVETSDAYAGKMRKFKATDSAGLRIRSHPSLQSEQIGRLPINGVIRFTMEVHNEDGIWVKLNDPSVKAFCDSLAQTKNLRTEGWCLQYNQHVGKTLLFPVEGPKQLPDPGHGKGMLSVRKLTEPSFANNDKSSKALRLNGSPGLYQVVNCGVSGHNIRARPSLRSTSVGILAMGMKFHSVDECINNDGLWVKLDHSSQQKYCYTSEGEAWSLAVGKGDTIHLRLHDASKSKKGFDFSIASQHPQNIFDSVSPPPAFGSVDLSTPFQEVKSSEVTNTTAESILLPTLLDDMADDIHKSTPAEVCTSSAVLSKLPAPVVERSSVSLHSETQREEKIVKHNKSIKTSSFSALQKWLQLGSESRGSSDSTPSSNSVPNEMTKSLVRERICALSNDKCKSVSSATQTSPEEVLPTVIPTATQFNIGTAGPSQTLGFGLSPVCNSKSSPKTERKHKSGSSRPRSSRREREKERSKSPQRLGDFPVLTSAPVKSAIGPGQAQSVRAVFGAVLWNSGIIHDAMACSSYLRFKHTDSNVNSTLTTKPLGVEEDELLVAVLSQAEADSAEKGSQPAKKVDQTCSNVETTHSVILRKKPGSPGKGKQHKPQRHSVEVTSAAWFLKDNPQLKIEDFYLQIGDLEKRKEIIPDTNTDRDGSQKENIAIEISCEEELPPAMAGLEKIWNFVKQTCSECVFRDFVSIGPLDAVKSTPVKMRKERKSCRAGNADSKCKSKKERPKQLHSIGRSFLLGSESEESREFSEEMQQCQMCQVRFPRKAKSRSAHFGLSIMCENCSERHLKMKKQQCLEGKAQLSINSGESTVKNPSPTEILPPQSTIMNNSFFLLQMINTVCDSHPQPNSAIIPLKSSFSCYNALGMSESQTLDDGSSFFDDYSPDGRTSELDIKREARSSSNEIFTNSRPVPRRRKVSNGDPIFGADDSGFALLLNHPSPALEKILDAGKTGTEAEAISKMCGGIVNFVVDRHDLDNLKLYLFQAIRRVTCRSYGMQILAWLIKNVSQPTALHDLLWWYASSLEIKPDEEVIENENLDNGWWHMRTHPLSESPATVFPVLTESFHILLQTISDVMPLLPIGSSLLEMAVKCWGVCFSRKDHKFLHRSKIFRNLSQIMSQFDSENDWSKSSLNADSQNLFNDAPTETTICLSDLTSSVDVKVSSRGALCPSLTDVSTETFWESGEEDRSRTKSITLTSSGDINVRVLAIHVDNIRDSQYKVSSITVKVGQHLEELLSVGHVEIDIRHCGWCWFPIDSKISKIFKMELKGPDNTLRVRQIKVLGFQPNQSDVIDKPGMSTWISMRKCENETLRIFRLLSSEVFGKLLLHFKRGDEDAEANDLQEHVVGILFSRNKLSHLQKQVCSHIVGAIHREAIKIKEEFNSHNTSGSILEAAGDNIRLIVGEKPKVGDRYCFEMLSLVLALAGSKTGRSYLSQQSNLTQDLMQLLHVGTPRIQRQVTSVLRKILPEIKPEDFAKIACNQDIHFGESTLGILDMLLGCIIKSLQVKVRTAHDGNRSARNISTSEIYSSEELAPVYWFLRGEGDMQLANTVVKLIKDMCEDSFSKEWTIIAKPAIAEAVLYLTKIDAPGRSSEQCLISPKFWIALAALCVLHPDHSVMLSSPVFQNGGSGRAKCVNHDDGETLAVIHCNECLDLCAECDRFLHLPKKNWNHLRKVCKEEEESIRVDLHEGCGRIKLFWLMALADSSTLKALVEFRNEIPKTFTDSVAAVTTVGRCRFCSKVGNTGPLALGNVCGEPECQEYSRTACERILDCGHICGGVRNEMKCLPCLQGCSDKLGTVLKQDSDDMCMICFTDALAFAPAIQLSCGHVFHYHCVRCVLERRWAGPRITFAFSYCPICKADICHTLLEDVLNPIHELFLDVQRKSLMRLEYEGLNNIEAITMPGGRYYNNPAGFAMDRYAYYVCFKCNKAYFGGEARCDLEMPLEFDSSELVCGGCSDVSQAQLCPRHGTDFLEYKCRYCCSVAVFFCFGTTHFCNGCHDDFQRITAMPKNQLPNCPAGPRATQLEGEECPLHIFHPPTGEEFALGCGICRNAHTF